MKTETFLPALWTRLLAVLATVAIVAMLSSCAHFNPPQQEAKPEPPVAEKKPPPEPIKPPPPSPLYEWYGTDKYVSHIEVSVNEQKARFYSGDKQVGWTTVASGIHKYPTPIGAFAVTEKVQNKESNLYGKIYNKNGKLVKRNAKMGVHPIPAGGRFKGAPMPYFLRLTNDGIGMHAGPIPRPGNRASHGCIRMPKKLAPILYRYVDIGTPVTIKGTGPTYASYLAKQRRSRPKPAPAAVAEVNPPSAPPASTAPETSAPVPAAGQTATASGMNAVVTLPPTEAATTATTATTAETAVAPVPSEANAPHNTSDSGTTPPGSPVTGFVFPSGGVPPVPVYRPSYSVPAAVPDEAPPALPTAPVSGIPGLASPLPSDPSMVPTPAAVAAHEASQTPESLPAHGTMGAAGSPVPPTKQQPAPVEATPPPAATTASEQDQG